MVVLTSRQPVAELTTTGSLVPMRTWRTTIGAPQPAHMRWPPARPAPLGHQLQPLLAGALEVVGLLEGVDRTDVDALAAEDAAALVDLERAQRALVERQGAGGTGGDAAAAADAVGQLQGLAVRRVDVDGEASAGEVVAGRAGHVAADPHATAAGDAALHVAPDEGMLQLGLHRADAAALLDQVVGGDAVLARPGAGGRSRPGWGTRTAGSAWPPPGRRPGCSPSRPPRRGPPAVWPWRPWASRARASGSAPAPILSHTGSRSASRCAVAPSVLGLLELLQIGQARRSRPASSRARPGLRRAARRRWPGRRACRSPPRGWPSAAPPSASPATNRPVCEVRPVNRLGCRALAADLERRCRCRSVLGGEDDGGAGLGAELLGGKPLGRRFELEGDALLPGGRDLAGAGGHGVGAVAGDDGHGLGAGAQGRAGGVDRGDAVADDDHPAGESGPLPVALLPQELDGRPGWRPPSARLLGGLGPSPRCSSTTASNPASNRPCGSVS